ncbi:hypothetical protein PIROE2DRAFT_1146 [Piromyces sp. E2]|nr:hypothetical protein PIROE2DRAFT_1146 [Piromyces sp. E2]|eukprot:OUM70619.1 hypothetical protein PIROE2DRAFT_1146 [Piromyces sp. E2]
MINITFNSHIKKFLIFITFCLFNKIVYGEYYNVENNVVNIVNINTNLCLTYKSKDYTVRASNCVSNYLKQQWIVPKDGNGYYVSRYDTNICLYIKDNGSIITSECSEYKTVMGNILFSKSKESLWTPDSPNLCVGILKDHLSLVDDETVRNAASIKLKMYSCSRSQADQHWKFNIISENYTAVKTTTTTTTKKTTTTTKKTTTTTKKTTTTTKKTTTTTKKTTTTTQKTTTTTTKTNETSTTSSKIHYTPKSMYEYDGEVLNPYIGWFHGAVTIDLNDYPELDCNFINRFHQVQKYKNGLQYLGVRLGEFGDREISEKALTALDNLLNEYKKRKENIDPTTQIILRFYYDGSNNCKTNGSSFDPILASENDDDDYTDNESDNKFSQLDNGHLYVDYEDFEYMQNEFDPESLIDDDSVEIMADSDEKEPEIGYFSNDNNLKIFNLENHGVGELNLSEDDQKKLSYKNKYFDQSYYNENNELTLTDEEMKDYLRNSIFINVNLNKTKLLEQNQKSNRATIDESFAVKNATEKDLSNSRINTAKELKQISLKVCVQKSTTDSSVCVKEKKISKFCIYQFTSSGCVKYSTEEIEPANIDIIIKHIKQLAPIVNKYKDLIYIYQGSFVGTYGEMHHSNYLELDSLTKIYKTIDKYFDPSIFLSVRTPRYYRGVSNMFKSTSSANYTSYVNRMGLYNDGLFYSETDYGTYGQSDISSNNGFVKAKREQEVQFQNDLCLTVPNGGEAVFNKNEVDNNINIKKSEISKLLSNVEFYPNFYVADQHARNIHLSYLNDEYDKDTFKHWNKTLSSYIYTSGWHVNGGDYIYYHLGYRYVLRSNTLLSNNVLNVVIENVGYAPAYVSFNPIITIKSTSPSQVIQLNMKTDNRIWGFIKQNGEYAKTVTLSVNLTAALAKLKGTSYTVYFNLNDPRTGVDIKFANTNTYYKDLGYRLGILTIE